jgi:sugar fermentation stimulation protein A
MSAVADGYEGYILFVIQMKEISCMMPNDVTHKAFGDALRKAQKSGVKILAVDCIVTPDSIACDKPVKVKL